MDRLHLVGKQNSVSVSRYHDLYGPSEQQHFLKNSTQALNRLNDLPSMGTLNFMFIQVIPAYPDQHTFLTTQDTLAQRYTQQR